MEKEIRNCYTADPYYYGTLKIWAKENRQFQTPEESLLWSHLRQNQLGLPFRRQHIIGNYIADFVCLKKKLVIEVDGGYHAQQEQKIKDYWRTKQLNEWGYRVVRIKNEDIYKDLSSVLDCIFDNLGK